MVADKFKNGVDPKISDPQLSGCSWTLKHFRIFPSSTILIFIKYISTLPIFAVVHNFPIHTLYAHMSCIWGGDMFIYIHNLGYLTVNVGKIHEWYTPIVFHMMYKWYVCILMSTNYRATDPTSK